MLLKNKEYSGAIAEAALVLKNDENDLEGLLLRGKGYYYIGDYDVAIRYEIPTVLLCCGDML